MFVLFEDLVDSDFLFEEIVGELDLLLNSSSIDLDFKDVVLLLSEVEFAHLGVDDNSNDGAVLLDSVKLSLDVLGVLSDLLGVLGESLSL